MAARKSSLDLGRVGDVFLEKVPFEVGLEGLVNFEPEKGGRATHVEVIAEHRHGGGNENEKSSCKVRHSQQGNLHCQATNSGL